MGHYRSEMMTQQEIEQEHLDDLRRWATSAVLKLVDEMPMTKLNKLTWKQFQALLRLTGMLEISTYSSDLETVVEALKLSSVPEYINWRLVKYKGENNA